MSEKKQEKDFTAEVDALLTEANELAKVSSPHLLLRSQAHLLSSNNVQAKKVEDAVEKLLVLEKQTRNVRMRYMPACASAEHMGRRQTSSRQHA
jgi:hypothetical protein